MTDHRSVLFCTFRCSLLFLLRSIALSLCAPLSLSPLTHPPSVSECVCVTCVFLCARAGELILSRLPAQDGKWCVSFCTFGACWQCSPGLCFCSDCLVRILFWWMRGTCFVNRICAPWYVLMLMRLTVPEGEDAVRLWMTWGCGKVVKGSESWSSDVGLL